jgi:hypothetical protein
VDIDRVEEHMEKKAEIFKVDYKDLVREIKRTKKTLERIQPKVGGRQRSDISQQIKSLDYLEDVCAKTNVGVTLAGVKPKMSGCKLVANRMSKFYSNV